MSALRDWLSGFLSIFLPFSCHLCGTGTRWGEVVCPPCSHRLTGLFHPPRESTDVETTLPLHCLATYDGLLAEAVRVMKYRPSPALLAHMLSTISRRGLLTGSPLGAEVVIPVPMHPSREAKRGFNQAERLARTVAGELKIPFSPALVRSRATRPQADCDEQERAENLTGAFTLASGLLPGAFRNKHLLLVDDVATTGATLTGCADALAPLQPAGVAALVLAHTPRRLPRETE